MPGAALFQQGARAAAAGAAVLEDGVGIRVLVAVAEAHGEGTAVGGFQVKIACVGGAGGQAGGLRPGVDADATVALLAPVRPLGTGRREAQRFRERPQGRRWKPFAVIERVLGRQVLLDRGHQGLFIRVVGEQGAVAGFYGVPERHGVLVVGAVPGKAR